MGWWGKPFYSNSMADVRRAIEADVGCTVVNLKYGYAVCVVTQQDIEQREFLRNKPELLNLITIALWRKSGGCLMIKQVSEDMGPCEVNVPMKYINATCTATESNEYAVRWRERVRQYHARRKEQTAIARNMQAGDKFYVYGDLFEYRAESAKRNCITAVECNTGKVYRIRNTQISMER